MKHSHPTTEGSRDRDPAGNAWNCARALLLGLGLALAACATDEQSPGTDLPAFSDPRPADPQEVSEIQTLLAERGYDPGPADGIPGRRTAAAIKRYQSDAGLPEDGEPTVGLLARLTATADEAARPVERPAAPVEAVPMASDDIGYQPGDRYVYADGLVETVQRVGMDRVSWRDSNGDSFTSMTAVGLPLVDWGYGAWLGRSETARDESAPWPPMPETEAVFDVRTEEWTGEGDDRQVTDTRWTCRNDGKRKVQVPAGRFDAIAIACERSPAPAGVWQRRVWFSVPEIGHPVRRDDLDGAGIELQSARLVAALPGGKDWPPAVRAGLQAAVQEALNTRPVGRETAWRSTAIGDSFTILVTREFRDSDGMLCRTYVLTRRRGDTGPRRLYPALACKPAGDTIWRTPRLETPAG